MEIVNHDLIEQVTKTEAYRQWAFEVRQKFLDVYLQESVLANLIMTADNGTQG